jgi:hypothetical protein
MRETAYQAFDSLRAAQMPIKIELRCCVH